MNKNSRPKGINRFIGCKCIKIGAKKKCIIKKSLVKRIEMESAELEEKILMERQLSIY